MRNKFFTGKLGFVVVAVRVEVYEKEKLVGDGFSYLGPSSEMEL